MTKKRYTFIRTGGHLHICVLCRKRLLKNMQNWLLSVILIRDARITATNGSKKFKQPPIPACLSQDFDRMITECKPIFSSVLKTIRSVMPPTLPIEQCLCANISMRTGEAVKVQKTDQCFNH